MISGNKNMQQKKRVHVFGSVILFPGPKCDADPQLLLVVDYQSGQVKVAGGKSESGETSLVAMNREFFEETGLRDDGWTFIDDDRCFIHEDRTRDCHYYLKVISMQPNDPLWRMASKPACLGETAGVAWVPIRQSEGAFPADMSNVTCCSGALRYINHEVIWRFCEILQLVSKGSVNLPNFPLPSVMLGFRYRHKYNALESIHREARRAAPVTRYVVASVIQIPEEISMDAKWDAKSGLSKLPHILCVSSESNCTLTLPIVQLPSGSNAISAANGLCGEQSGITFDETDKRFEYELDGKTYECFLKLQKTSVGADNLRHAIRPQQNAAYSWFALSNDQSEWLANIVLKTRSGDQFVFQQILWKFCCVLADRFPAVRLPPSRIPLDDGGFRIASIAAAAQAAAGIASTTASLGAMHVAAGGERNESGPRKKQAGSGGKYSGSGSASYSAHHRPHQSQSGHHSNPSFAPGSNSGVIHAEDIRIASFAAAVQAAPPASAGIVSIAASLGAMSVAAALEGRDPMTLKSLGEHVSVNIAFVRVVEGRPQVYTMVENKRGDRKRNCQGGYMEISVDRDVFAAAAREAFEEINPIGKNEAARWMERVSNMVRELYTSHSSRLSSQITFKNNDYKGRLFVGVHVSFRVIADAGTWEALGLVAKAEGSIDSNEVTSDLRWDDLAHINAHPETFFSFANQPEDIDTTENVFIRLQYTDDRIGCSVERCRSRDCSNTFLQKRDTWQMTHCRKCSQSQRQVNPAWERNESGPRRLGGSGGRYSGSGSASYSAHHRPHQSQSGHHSNPSFAPGSNSGVIHAEDMPPRNNNRW